MDEADTVDVQESDLRPRDVGNVPSAPQDESEELKQLLKQPN